jgi:hypothetical protein
MMSDSLFGVAPLKPQYPLYRDTSEDKSISYVLHLHIDTGGETGQDGALEFCRVEARIEVVALEETWDPHRSIASRRTIEKPVFTTNDAGLHARIDCGKVLS